MTKVERAYNGVVGARKAGKHGGKKPVEELYPEKAKHALKLKGSLPIRDIAERAGLTKREVEGVFARASRLSP